MCAVYRIKFPFPHLIFAIPCSWLANLIWILWFWLRCLNNILYSTAMEWTSFVGECLKLQFLISSFFQSSPRTCSLSISNFQKSHLLVWATRISDDCTPNCTRTRMLIEQFQWLTLINALCSAVCSRFVNSAAFLSSIQITASHFQWKLWNKRCVIAVAVAWSTAHSCFCSAKNIIMLNCAHVFNLPDCLFDF